MGTESPLRICQIHWPVVILLAAVPMTNSEGREDPLVGKKVTVIKWDAEFRSESNKVIGTSELGKNYEVYTVKGNKLYVRECDGYLLRSDIVPYDTAMNHFTSIVKRKLSANAYYDRGAAWEARDEIDEALKDYNEALRKNPKFAEVYNARANIHSLKGDYDKAIQDYDKSLQLGPGDSTVLCNRGMIYAAKGDLDRALQDYDKALETNSQYQPAYRERAEIWQKKSQLDKAVADYDMALKLNESDQRSRLNRGFLRSLQNDEDGAIADFNELIKREPQHARGLHLRGLTWIKKGVYTTAAADLSLALEANPMDFDIHVGLALIRVASPEDSVRNSAEAMELLAKAKELGNWKNSYQYQATLAAAHAELGEFDKALEVEESLSPRVPDALKAEHEARLKLYRDRKPFRLVPPKK